MGSVAHLVGVNHTLATRDNVEVGVWVSDARNRVGTSMLYDAQSTLSEHALWVTFQVFRQRVLSLVIESVYYVHVHMSLMAEVAIVFEHVAPSIGCGPCLALEIQCSEAIINRKPGSSSGDSTSDWRSPIPTRSCFTNTVRHRLFQKNNRSSLNT